MSSHRIGVLGGTFDPPHLGHVALADLAQAHAAIDELRIVVAADPWQKADRDGMATAEQRHEMASLAFSDVEGAIVDRREIDRGGVTYTYDTVVSLGAEYPGASLVLIAGTDVAAGLDSWHRAEEVAAAVEVAVVRRSGVEWRAPSPRWHINEILGDPPEVSSTEIRERCRRGEPVDDLISPSVWQFIVANELYGFRR